jgi:hypothetical protein
MTSLELKATTFQLVSLHLNHVKTAMKPQVPQEVHSFLISSKSNVHKPGRRLQQLPLLMVLLVLPNK